MLNESRETNRSKSTAAEPTQQCPDIKYKRTIKSNPNQFLIIKPNPNQFLIIKSNPNQFLIIKSNPNPEKISSNFGPPPP